MAAYSGDSASQPSTSGPESVKVKSATTSTALSVTDATTPDVGSPYKLVAQVTDTEATTPVTFTGLPVVEFFEGSTPIPGCAAAGVAASGKATCAMAPPTRTSKLSFHAKFCPAGASSYNFCEAWAPSTSATVTYTPVGAKAKVTLTPAATTTTTVPGGTQETVKATVGLASGTAAFTGTVRFEDNANPISAVPSGNCTAVVVTVTAPTATCTFVPATGANAVTAVYIPGATVLVTPPTTAPVTTLVVSSEASAVTVAVKTTTAGAPVTPATPASYGVPLTATATAKAGATVLKVGKVAFEADGSPVPGCTGVTVGTGTATCTLPDLAAGTGKVTATYTDTGGAYAKSTGTALFKIAAAPTSTDLSVGPDPGTAGKVKLTATVANTAADAAAAPVGTVTFTGDSTAVCTGVTLKATSGAVATAGCVITQPGSQTTYTASYTHTGSGDFADSQTPSPLVYNPGAACSATFTTLWGDAGKTVSFAAGPFGIAGDDVTVKLASETGNCSASHTIAFSSGSLSVLGGTLKATTGLAGYLQDAQTAGQEPSLCVTSGKLALPSGWKLGTLTLSTTAKLCFEVAKATSGGGTLGKITSGSLTEDGVTLPFGTPKATTSYDLAASFTDASSPTMTLQLAPATTPTTSVHVTAKVTVTVSSGSVTGAGTLAVKNLPFGTLTASFTVTAKSWDRSAARSPCRPSTQHRRTRWCQGSG
jgi:hypothetical protein